MCNTYMNYIESIPRRVCHLYGHIPPVVCLAQVCLHNSAASHRGFFDLFQWLCRGYGDSLLFDVHYVGLSVWLADLLWHTIGITRCTSCVVGVVVPIGLYLIQRRLLADSGAVCGPSQFLQVARLP